MTSGRAASVQGMESVGVVSEGGYVFPFSGMMRRARRIADMSQREMARAAGVSQAAISKVEAGTLTPSVGLLQRVLRVAGLWLVVVD